MGEKKHEIFNNLCYTSSFHILLYLINTTKNPLPSTLPKRLNFQRLNFSFISYFILLENIEHFSTSINQCKWRTQRMNSQHCSYFLTAPTDDAGLRGKREMKEIICIELKNNSSIAYLFNFFSFVLCFTSFLVLADLDFASIRFTF